MPDYMPAYIPSTNPAAPVPAPMSSGGLFGRTMGLGQQVGGLFGRVLDRMAANAYGENGDQTNLTPDDRSRLRSRMLMDIGGALAGGKPINEEIRQSREDETKRQESQAQSAYYGAQVGKLTRDADVAKNLVATAPPEDAAFAAADPDGYARWRLEQRELQVVQLGDGRLVWADKQGNIKGNYDAGPPLPEGWERAPDGTLRYIKNGPADPEYKGKVAGVEARERHKNDPSEWQVYGPNAGNPPEPTQSKVMGLILWKKAHGITLAPGENEIWSRYNNGPAGGFGYGGYTGAGPAATGGGAPPVRKKWNPATGRLE